MAFLQNPITYAVILTLTIIPLFEFRLIPHRAMLTKKQQHILWVINLLLLLANGAVVTVLYSDPTMSQAQAIQFFKLDICCVYLLALIPYAILLRKRIGEALFVFGLVGLFALLILSAGLFILHNFITAIHGLLRLEILCGVLLLIAGLMFPFIRSTLRRTVTPFHSENTPKYWSNIWIVPNAMLIASICAVPLDQFLTTVPYLISRLLIGLATVFMCRSIAFDYVLYSHNVNLQTQIDSQREYYTALSKKMQDDRKAHHDFKHQLSAICTMADNGDTDALKDYCHSLLNTTRGEAIPYTGNAALDGVLYRYTRRAEAEAVAFEIRGHFKPHSASEIDICVALGNALENAFTACANLPVSSRFVDVELLQEGELLTVTVKNSFDGVVLKEKGTILSRKRDHEQGIGLDSIQSICRTHNGTMTVHYDDSTFAVMMLMNIPD